MTYPFDIFQIPKNFDDSKVGLNRLGEVRNQPSYSVTLDVWISSGL